VAKNGFKVFDSDLHIMEPVDLWQRYIDKEFLHSAPRGTNRRVGDLALIHPDGRPYGMDTRSGNNRPPRDGTLSPRQERYKDHSDRGWTNECQLEAMDAEGVDVATLYPTRGLHAVDDPSVNAKQHAAVARAYNNWLYEFCQINPERMKGVAMISPWDIDDAVTETKRAVKELGFVGAFLRPNIVAGRTWHDEYYEPLWSTLEELDAALGFHEGVGTMLPEVGSIFGMGSGFLRHVYCHSGEQMLAVGSFTGGGIFARHPKLRVAFLEGNCSWLPWLLYRLDEHWEQAAEQDPESPFVFELAPSAYFKRQGYASVEADEEPAKYVVDFMGSDRLVFSTDYPHSDSKYPASVERFLRLDISDEDKRKILWDNCAEIYSV